MRLALYKGPADKLLYRIGEGLIRLRTLSRYSHAELCIDGWCWTSSYRDGGVRRKGINLTSGKWDVIPLPDRDEAAALAWFQAHAGNPYDWPGVLRFIFPFLRPHPGRYFCSEAVAAALGLPEPAGMAPQDLKDALT